MAAASARRARPWRAMGRTGGGGHDGDTTRGGRGVGECKPGTQTCVDHVWGACTGGTGPSDQSECDGKDHNCDGVADKAGCECAPGATETCGGPDVGQCK